jgi:hypothetical protein
MFRPVALAPFLLAAAMFGGSFCLSLVWTLLLMRLPLPRSCQARPTEMLASGDLIDLVE